MLPKGWVCAPLGDCVKFVSGGTPSKEHEDYWNGDFPWVTAKDMKTLWLTDSGLKLTPAGKMAATVIPAGTVLVLTRGMTLLKDLPVCIAKREMSFNQDIKAMLPFAGLNAEFLAFQLLGRKDEILELVDTAGHGTGRLDMDQLRQFQIRIPPCEEQKAIVNALCVWDAAITTTEKLLANSCRQKDALMEQLLGGKRRLYGPITERCIYRLGDLFVERVEPYRSDLPLLSVTRDEGVIPRNEVGRKDTSNEDKSKYLRVCVGDIAYNTMRMWQGVSALSRFEGIVSPAYTVVTPTKLIDAQFAAYLFKYPPVVFLFYRYSQGLVSDTWNLKYHHFSEIAVEIPMLREQVTIARILKDADEQISLLEEELNCLHQEKRALMADLLTGKRRVGLPAASAEPETA